MKKTVLLVVLPLLLLSSCEKKENHLLTVFRLKENTITLEDNSLDHGVIQLDYASFPELVQEKESFFLFVMAPGCGSCDFLSLTLKGFLKESDCIAYEMNLANYEKASLPSFPSLSDNSFLFIEKGNLLSYETAFGEKYNSLPDFTRFFFSHARLGPYNESDYQYTLPYRGDFNSYHFLSSIGKNDKTVHSAFSLNVAKKQKETVLFLNEKEKTIPKDSLYDYLTSHPEIDSFLFVTENIEEDTFTSLTSIVETAFTSLLVTYAEEGYSAVTVSF